MTKQSQYKETSKKFNEDQFFNEVLFESSNFKVIPSLGSMVEGWLLIIPKIHYLSMGEIKNIDLYNELEGIVTKVSEIVKKHYGDFVLFEHGPSELETKVGCGVDYAHLHIVPIKIDLVQKAKKQFKIDTWEIISDLSATSHLSAAKQSYLFVQDNEKNRFIGTSSAITSQLFRKIIATHLGIPERFNWKEHQFSENIKKTIFQLCRYSHDESDKVNVVSHE